MAGVNGTGEGELTRVGQQVLEIDLNLRFIAFHIRSEEKN